jgi:hypothetical protein
MKVVILHPAPAAPAKQVFVKKIKQQGYASMHASMQKS